MGALVVKNTPMVSQAAKGVSAAQDGNIGSLAADVGTFALSALTTAADPLNALITAGLGFLEDVCQPIQDCVDAVTGNPDKLDECKDAFTDVSRDIGKLAGELDQITTSGLQNWSGDAKNAATQAISTFVQGVEGTANNASDIAQVLGISGTLMDAAKTIINGILATFIEWLIATWVVALATSVFTFGASDAAATAATAAEATVEGANAADKVEQTTSLIQKIVKAIEDIIEKIKSFGHEISKNHSLLSEGKDAIESTEGAAKEAGKAAEAAGKDAGKAAESAGKDAGAAGKDAAETVKGAQKPNLFQNKLNEAKEGLANPIKHMQENVTSNAGKGFGSYLTSGSGSGPSPLADTFIDAGLEAGANETGNLVDPMGNSYQRTDAEDGPSGWPSQSGTIDEDLKG
ncbi:MAG TPA: hypothetical protein VHX38_33960 [Pseudonocardiaceae bacterium]|nr:hypothetical protein [Pseudonocardiaceae bacterium]